MLTAKCEPTKVGASSIVSKESQLVFFRYSTIFGTQTEN